MNTEVNIAAKTKEVSYIRKRAGLLIDDISKVIRIAYIQMTVIDGEVVNESRGEYSRDYELTMSAISTKTILEIDAMIADDLRYVDPAKREILL